jgi:hypothetical protein
MQMLKLNVYKSQPRMQQKKTDNKALQCYDASDTDFDSQT